MINRVLVACLAFLAVSVHAQVSFTSTQFDVTAIALSDGAPLTPEHLPSIGGTTAAVALASSHDEDVSTLSPELLKERQALREQLEAQRWNVSHVAKSLGLSRNTLYRRMHKLRIPVTHCG